MQYSLVLFDLDGTLLNTLTDLTASVNHALTSCRLPRRSESEVRSYVGNGIHRLIELAVPDGTASEQTEHVLALFHDHYRSHCADQTTPYDGVRELLSHIREAHVQTAVVSNKADYAVQALCKEYFDGLLTVALGVKPPLRRKPSPDMLLEVLRLLSLRPADAIYVGDSEVDIRTAHNAGMEVISVDWGFRDRSLLVSAGASFLASSTEELWALLSRTL